MVCFSLLAWIGGVLDMDGTESRILACHLHPGLTVLVDALDYTCPVNKALSNSILDPTERTGQESQDEELPKVTVTKINPDDNDPHLQPLHMTLQTKSAQYTSP